MLSGEFGLLAAEQSIPWYDHIQTSAEAPALAIKPRARCSGNISELRMACGSGGDLRIIDLSTEASGMRGPMVAALNEDFHGHFSSSQIGPRR